MKVTPQFLPPFNAALSGKRGYASLASSTRSNAIVLLILEASVAAGAVVYDSGPPSGAVAGPVSGFALADDFMLSTPTQLTGAEFWTLEFDATPWNGILHYFLLSTNGDEPSSTPLVIGLGTQITRTATGSIGNGSVVAPEYAWQFQFEVPIMLDANERYWLALSIDEGLPIGPGPQGHFWEASQLELGFPSRRGAFSSPVSFLHWQELEPTRSAAFRLIGQPVPEPSSIGFWWLSLGLLSGCIGHRRFANAASTFACCPKVLCAAACLTFSTCFAACNWPADVRGQEPNALKIPAYLTRYDLATREDLLYCRLLNDLVLGDEPAQWGMLSGVAEQVGGWVAQYLDAQRIAGLITSGLPIEGQPQMGKLDELAQSCATILGLPRTMVYLRNAPETSAYATTVEGRPVLVLTSGLLALFEDRPEELQFIVGRELGHVKCEHQRIRAAAFGILRALEAISDNAIPDEFREVLPTLALGRLFDWTREAEISADRAGLVCCQNIDVAEHAMLRLMHGLKPSNKLLDLDAEEIDAARVVQSFDRWQNKPFVQFITRLKQSSASVPFLPERIAAVRSWAISEEYQSILAREVTPTAEQRIVLRRVGLSGVAPTDGPVNTYVVVFNADQELARTTTARQVTSVTWEAIDTTHRCAEHQPLFFEIWEDGWTGDKLLGGFVIYPRRGQTIYSTSIVWDWKERMGISRAGIANVELGFRETNDAKAKE